MSPEDLMELHERHTKDYWAEDAICRECCEDWPCLAVRLLDEHERMTEWLRSYPGDLFSEHDHRTERAMGQQ